MKCSDSQGQLKYTDKNFTECLSIVSFYPFREDGELCPYLNNADRLFQLLQLSTHRQTFKKFCKSKEWPGKPSIPQVMTDEALKPLFLSACNSAEVRRAMASFEECISLHRIIYDAVLAQNHKLHDACLDKLSPHNRKKRNNFITPKMFREVLAEHAIHEQHHEVLHLLGLSLAICNQQQAVEYIDTLLQYYPDSAAVMGCLKEDKSSEKPASDNEKTLDHSTHLENGELFCALTCAEELGEQLSALKFAFDEHQRELEQIASANDLRDFSKAGLVDTSIRALTRTHSLISRLGDKITEILGVKWRCPVGLECTFTQKFGKFGQCPPVAIRQLITVSSQALEAMASVEAQGTIARAKLQSLENQAKNYSYQIGHTDVDHFGNAALKHPCEATQAILSMQIRVDQLKIEFDTKLKQSRSELLAHLDSLELTENPYITPYAKQLNEQIAKIRRSLDAAKDIPSIDDCWSRIHSLEPILHRASSTPGLTTMSSLASRLQSNRESTIAVLELSEALLDLGQLNTALLILLTRQHVYSAGEITEEPDRLIGTLVDAVCRIGDAQGNFSHIWHALCDTPWLLAIGRNDLKSTDLIERLAVMYSAEAISGSNEKSANALLSLGISDRTDLSLPPSINELVEAIVSRRSFRILTVSAVSRIDEMRKEIEECIAFENGKYRHIQCSKATHFARFESIKVFPELERFWTKVLSAINARQIKEALRIAQLADPDEWIEQMNKNHDRDMYSHPHFSAKIMTFVASFIELVLTYIHACGEAIQGTDIIISEQQLRQELAQWGGDNTARQRVAKCFNQQTNVVRTEFGCQELLEILLSSQEVIKSCPSAVAWTLSQRLLLPTLDFETYIIEDLCKTRSQQEVDELLSPHQGWASLKTLWQNTDQDRELDYAKKEEEERRELQCNKQVIIDYSDESLVKIFDACCTAGRFEAARGILDECKKYLAKEFTVRMDDAASRVTQALEKLNSLKELAEDQNMPSEWVESVYAQASKIERPLKQMQRAITNENQIDFNHLSQLEDSIRALMIVVHERSNNFDAVKFHLEGGDLTSIALRGLVVSERDAHARCPELVDAWETLRSCGEDKVHAAWVAFAKLFGKLCNLYHDEKAPNGRFAPVTPFSYPHSIYQTAFYKPKSEFLKRPLRFYLYRDDVDNQARQRLDAELSEEQSAAWLHVIFAPNGADKLRIAFQLNKKFRSVLVIDDAFLYRICIEEKHDVPIRRGLHGVVADLSSSSPFVANGYCHQENNIYVGRAEVIQRLLNHPQAMIWGGRRIGKTSVLHVLESTLARRQYQVALAYADTQGSVDPDLIIVQRLADSLGLTPVKSVPEFVQKIQSKQKNGVKFAFLLDEVDEYIKKSRIYHNGEFPLASALRQIVMEDSTKSTVLVYSGYHQLYFEAKLGKSKKRVGHPFVNIASDFQIRDLSHDEVIELVRTGFEEMLGIDLHPDVPSLVAERASRHPAFVQEFCRCLLAHVSRRRSHSQTRIIISTKDVEEVYKSDGRGDGGEQPFIFYVDETLGYNLSALGRAIMLTIDSSKFYSKEEIRRELNFYAQAAGVKEPKEEHFSDTIDLLVMTNLLTQDSARNEYYRMTYTTFIDILGRLNKLGKTEIEKSLKSYEKNEMDKGILR